jgi:hypothetical protein
MKKLLPLTCLCATMNAALSPAQKTTIVRDDPSFCRGCTIELTPVVTINLNDHAKRPPQFFEEAIVGRHGLVVLITVAPPRFYKLDGTLVRELTKGGGPGEYKAVSGIAAVGEDSVALLDGNRISIFSIDGRFLSAIALPVALHGPLMPADGSLFTSGVFASGGKSFQLARIGLDGSVAYSRPIMPTRIPLDPFRARLALAPRTGGGYWAAHILRYQIDLIDATGRVSETILRAASWFPNSEDLPSHGASPALRPTPYLFGVQQSDSGRLWTLTSVGRDNWARALGPLKVRRPPRASFYPIEVDTLFRESRIELLDPRAGKVVASRIMPGQDVLFAGPDLITQIIRDEDDAEILYVWRISLERPRD